MAATIIYIILPAVFVAVSYLMLIKRLRETEARITRLESERVITELKINECKTAANRMMEVVESNEEYLKQAIKTEQLMQDGINSIMNYDAMSFAKGDNK